jgi:hypothetical protein
VPKKNEHFNENNLLLAFGMAFSLDFSYANYDKDKEKNGERRI